MNLNITSPITYIGGNKVEYGCLNFTAQIGNKTVDATYKLDCNNIAKIKFAIRADIESLGIVIDDSEALATLADFAKAQQIANDKAQVEKEKAERLAAYANSIHVKLGRLVADGKLPDCAVMNYLTQEEFITKADNFLTVVNGQDKVNIVLQDGKFYISQSTMFPRNSDRKTSKIDKVANLVLEHFADKRIARSHKASVEQQKATELAKMVQLTGCAGLKSFDWSFVLPKAGSDWDNMAKISGTGPTYTLTLSNVPENKLRAIFELLGLGKAE